MSRPVDYVQKHFRPLQQKTLQNALAHVIGRQFPRLGGPRIRQLCANMILEVVDAHVRPSEHVRHGQALWMGIAVDDPPRRYRSTADTRLVPVLLDLSTPEDVQGRLDRKSSRERLGVKAARLCRQAHAQGALLSNCDLAELLHSSDSTIASVLVAHEKSSGQLLPRRATLHDVGTCLTHKRIICLKRYAEGKPPEIVAKETYHSQEAVDHYLSQFDRVRYCCQQGMTPEKTAFTLNCGVALVKEYLAIDNELEHEYKHKPQES